MRVSKKPRQRPETACVPVGAACAGVAVAPLWALSSVIKPGFHCHPGENKPGSFRGHLAISVPYSHDPSTPLLERVSVCVTGDCMYRAYLYCALARRQHTDGQVRGHLQCTPLGGTVGEPKKNIYFFGTVVSNAIVSWLIPSQRIVFFLFVNQPVNHLSSPLRSTRLRPMPCRRV